MLTLGATLQSVAASSHPLEPRGPEKQILLGECQTSAAPLAEQGGVRFGIWACTPGEWRSTWKDWECFTVLSGRGELVDGDGRVHELEAGTAVLVPAGTIGTWRVVETIRKVYAAPVTQSGSSGSRSDLTGSGTPAVGT